MDSYSSEDAEAILKIASRAGLQGEVSKDELLRTASELGISPSAVEEAERTFALEQKESRDQRQFRRLTRNEFYEHFSLYLVICGALGGFDFLKNDHHLTWTVWMILGWGLGVLFNAKEAFFKSTAEYDRAFRKWQRKQDRRAEKAETGSVGAAEIRFQVHLHNSIESPGADVNSGVSSRT